MEMKRTSFVCFGARGAKDALVYQEIPGRDGGEEFFLFFSPGRAEQEPVLRGMFREAVSASRLGAPAHYFTRFFEQFKAVAAEGGGDGAVFEDVLLMIVIRRGNDVHLLCNRNASLLHGDVRTGLRGSPASLSGFCEVPLGNGVDQRDLFRRSPEDMLALYRFTIGEGEHTLILAPSDEFVARHDESLRNTVFFPSFELPRDTGIEIAVSRSFPALHWRGETLDEPAPARRRSARVPLRVNRPLIAGCLAGAVVIAVLVGSLARRDRERGPDEPNAVLGAADGARTDSATARADESPAAARPERPPGDVGRERIDFTEAWKRTFVDAVTSSARYHRGTVYFGCRDGHLYAFTPDGSLAWKYRARAGIGASPCCVEGRVIGADYRGTLFCLDAGTGKALWSFATRSKIVSTPDCSGDLVFAATTDGRVFAVRLADARKVWEKKLGASIRGDLVAGKDYVLAVTTDGALFRIDRRGTIVWRTKIGAGVASSPACDERRDLVVCGAKDRGVHGFSLASGARKWRFAADSAVDGSAACGAEAIYVGSRNGTLYALSFDGAPRWKCAVGGVVHSRPLIEDSFIFVTTYAAELVAVDSASGELSGAYRAGSAIYSSPESDGKHLFFGSNGGVFHAIRLKATAAA
jgi:outer membrane protein assembly factor BamB